MNIYQPLIELLPGADGIKEAYRRSLDKGAVDIACFSDTYETVIGDAFFKDYAAQLYANSTREILPDTTENRECAKHKQKRNQVRFIPNHSLGETDMLLTNSSVTFISFQAKYPYALCIQDEELVKSFRATYETVWNSLG